MPTAKPTVSPPRARTRPWPRICFDRNSKPLQVAGWRSNRQSRITGDRICWSKSTLRPRKSKGLKIVDGITGILSVLGSGASGSHQGFKVEHPCHHRLRCRSQEGTGNRLNLTTKEGFATRPLNKFPAPATINRELSFLKAALTDATTSTPA